MIAQEAGGDPSAALLITGRNHSVAKPMTYYGALAITKAIKIHAVATSKVDRHAHDDCPSELATLSLGDPNTPTDEAVQHLVSRLKASLESGDEDFDSKHFAMMKQTCALVSFALALRGNGVLPSFSAVDRQTGFCQIHDKFRRDPLQARLLWVPQIARDQLQMYEEHLGRIERHLGIAARLKLTEHRQKFASVAPLFWIQDRYRIQFIDLQTVLKSGKSFGWPGRQNAGRHWLRSKMSGRCSAETLSAYFGHWQVGVEPWGATSSLDPLAYRADLKRCLDPILQDVGWCALPTPVR
jgi:hypothetical protein